MKNSLRFAKKKILPQLIEALLAVRALLFVGNKHVCPCCGWKLRAFTHGGTSFKTRHHGYCPRCNAKARHRRDWLFLQEKTNLFRDDLRVLHVSPKYSLLRRLQRMGNLDYTAVDLYTRPHMDVKMNLAATPLRSNIFDAIICIHVLEHVKDDRSAMHELYRVLKPGGWALISVPVRFDQPTYEDPTITTPDGRRRAFGETSHYRVYGNDLAERLEAYGFQVQIDYGQDLDAQTMARYGLLDDENVFFCTKE